MAINWKKFFFVRRDSGSLIRAGIICFIGAVGLLYFYLTRETIRGSDNVTFIKGPFNKYSWIDYGMDGASLTFELQNYSNRFKIDANFFSILQKNRFKSIPSGDTLTIGIPNRFVKYLNTPKQPFFVYSIASKDFIYLDLKETIKLNNTPGPLIAAIVFVILGLYTIHLGRRAKVKTPIW
jgi:hypothetical protein